MSVKKIIRSEDIKIKNDNARSVLPGARQIFKDCFMQKSLGIAALYHNSDWITDNLRKMARWLVHEPVAINSSHLKNSGDYLISSSTFMMSFS